MPESSSKEGVFSFTKAARLLKRSQFLALTNRYARPDLTIKAGSFLVLASANGLDLSRLGVTVTKKVGSAVTRNRLKRRVREFFRICVHRWPQGLDLVFIARHHAGARSSSELAADLEKIDQKLRRFHPEKQAEDRPQASGPGGEVKMHLEPTGGCKPVAARAANTADPADSLRNEARIPEPVPAGSEETPAAFTSAPDFSRPPFESGNWLSELSMALWRLPSRLALGFIFFYQKCISPMLPPSCRFRPTCSSYAAEAVKIHGFWHGSYLAGRRLLKCHPFHPGGYDPVPPKNGPPAL